MMFYVAFCALFSIALGLVTSRISFKLDNEPSTSPMDVYALHALYNATHGENWVWKKRPGTEWFFNASSDPCTQRWVGIVCFNETNMGYLHVRALLLENMGLTGYLPEEISDLTFIDTISLGYNSIGGTLPSSLGYLHNLTVLRLEKNAINGSIPYMLKDCRNLRVLELGRNRLSGTLPEQLGQLGNLTLLQLESNKLSGTIPDSFQHLVQLSSLQLSANRLNGTIPNFLAELPLKSVILNNNSFTGTIPNGFAVLPTLIELRLVRNNLEGTIPHGFGSLPRFVELSVRTNSLSGSIPADLFSSSQLQFLVLDDNVLTGRLPDIVTGKSNTDRGMQLHICTISNNQLTGSIPSSLGSLTNITVLELSFNALTSTIPPALGNLVRAVSLDFSANHLTGTLPEELGNLLDMEYFQMGSNQLVGTIPNYLGNFARLGFLLLQLNHFTGTLPQSLSQLTQLQQLFADHNLLVGTLDGVFDPVVHARLSVVQLDGNAFSGQIPDELFLAPRLNTVVLDSNCFGGSLPRSVCEATHLRTLSASGLRTDPSCRRSIFGSLADTYTLQRSIDGGVPACYFALPRLTSLHLSGNGLNGKIPDVSEIGTFLIDVVLSHNHLTGSIPDNIQQRQWYNLDLSYNRLSGTLRSDFATVPPNVTALVDFGLQNITHPRIPGAALKLRNNRLSRTVPEILHAMENISVLAGNLFGCEISHVDLPKHDGALPTYSCGSNTFNISYTIYMSVLAAVLLAVVVLYYYRDAVRQRVDVGAAISTLRKWISFADWYRRAGDGEQFMLHYGYLVHLYDKMCMVAAYCTAYMVVVLVPVYAAISFYYGTHTSDYAWVVSAAYASGTNAMAIMIVFVCPLLALFLYRFRTLIMWAQQRLVNHVHRIHSLRLSSINLQRAASTQRKVLTYSVFAAINIITVSLVNIAYVLAIYRASPVFQTLAQLALSAFRLVWTTYGSQYLLRACLRRLSTDQKSLRAANNSAFFAVQLFVALFNAIIVPCVVLALIGPDCFYSAFVPASDVVGDLQYPVCDLPTVQHGCLAYRTQSDTLRFAPPFVYSYECSGSLVTFYAPTFVYTGLMVTFLNPLLNHLQRWVFIHTPRTSQWFWLVDKMVPRVLRPVNAGTVQYDAPYQYSRPYFDANFMLITMVTYLGVILTFGVVFPPVAVVMLIAMLSVVYLSRVQIGRFLSEAVANNVHRYVDILDEECRKAGSVRKLQRCIRMLAVTAGLFYPFFLFDTLGDKVGANYAYWVFIVTPLAPIVMFIVLEATEKKVVNIRGRVESLRQGLELQPWVLKGSGGGAAVGSGDAGLVGDGQVDEVAGAAVEGMSGSGEGSESLTVQSALHT